MLNEPSAGKRKPRRRQPDTYTGTDLGINAACANMPGLSYAARDEA
jgi:hypothetical protein